MDLEFDFEKRYRLIREIIETLVLTVLMFLVIRLAVQNFYVDGRSMEPNLHNQELVLVDKWSYKFNPPARGDVIVFVAPPNPSQDYIKRIIGLPGDIVTVQGTRVYINGTLLDETYIDPHDQGNPFPPFKNVIIPQGDYFVLGDDRVNSSDSRDWGCVPDANIIGRAALVYWPLGKDNNGLLPGVSATYKHIGVPPTQGVDPQNTCPLQPPRPAAASSSHALSSPQMGMVLTLALPAAVVGFSRRQRRKHVPKQD